MRDTVVKNNAADELFKMKMHETKYFGDIGMQVTRVHMGWIYSNYDHKEDMLTNSVFVPIKSN